MLCRFHSLYRCSHLLSLIAIRCHCLSLIFTLCHSLYHLLSLVVNRCHSLYHWLSLVVIRCHTLYHWLSLVVIRCHLLYHWLSLVVTRCTTRLSFYKRSLLQVFLIKKRVKWKMKSYFKLARLDWFFWAKLIGQFLLKEMLLFRQQVFTKR